MSLVRQKSLGIASPESAKQRTFCNNVQKAVPDLVEQEGVKKVLETPDDVTAHQDKNAETREV